MEADYNFEKTLDNFSAGMYYEEKQENIGRRNMTTRELLEAAMDATNSTQASIAKDIGWTAQKLWSKLKNDSLRVCELIEILDKLGLDISITKRNNGREVRRGAGRRVHGVVDYVSYDTQTSDVLANNFYADGKNEYQDGKAFELYVDHEGRYFFAEYSSLEGVKDRITPITAETAAEFIKKYGTEIHKTPKLNN